MKELRHVIDLPVDPATAWEVFESDAFRERLSKATGMRMTVLSQHQEGDVTVTHLRNETGQELPGFAAKLLGTAHLAYEQHSRLDPATSTLTWRAFVPSLGDRMKVEGSTRMEATATGCRRVVVGSITVNVPLVGGQVEGLVASKFEQSIGRAAEVGLALMRERGLA